MAFNPEEWEPVEEGRFDPSEWEPVSEPEERSWGEAAADTGLDLARGVISAGEGVIGILDLFTGNRAGDGLEAIGYRPDEAHKFIAEYYSDPRKEADERVAQADGFVDTVLELVDNPEAAVGTIVQSAPQMIGSAGAARALALKLLSKNGLKAGTKEAMEFLSQPKIKAKLLTAGAAAEGAMAAGIMQEGARQEGLEWEESAPEATMSGALTGAITKGVGRVLPDPEVSAATRNLTSPGDVVGAGKNIVQGMGSEGIQETLQSGQEQAFENVMHDRPIGEGVGSAMGQGLIAGAGMGGGMQAAGELSTFARQKGEQLIEEGAAEGNVAKIMAGADQAAGSIFDAQPNVAPVPITPELRADMNQAFIARSDQPHPTQTNVPNVAPPQMTPELRADLNQAQLDRPDQQRRDLVDALGVAPAEQKKPRETLTLPKKVEPNVADVPVTPELRSDINQARIEREGQGIKLGKPNVGEPIVTPELRSDLNQAEIDREISALERIVAQDQVEQKTRDLTDKSFVVEGNTQELRKRLKDAGVTHVLPHKDGVKLPVSKREQVEQILAEKPAPRKPIDQVRVSQDFEVETEVDGKKQTEKQTLVELGNKALAEAQDAEHRDEILTLLEAKGADTIAERQKDLAAVDDRISTLEQLKVCLSA